MRHGILAVPDADPLVLRAVTLRGVLTCVSALATHGVAMLRGSPAVHLAVSSTYTTAGRDVRGVRLHYRVDARGPEGNGPPVAVVAQALDDAGRCLDERSHLVAVDSALHQGLVTHADIAAFTATPAARRQWLLAHADGRSESVGETLARLDCVKRGLSVHPQRFLPHVGRVDLVVEGQVVIEVDGRAFHSDRESFVRDRRRGRRAVRAGLPVLRFAAAELLGSDAVDVGAEVEAFLAEHKPRRPGRS